MVPYNLQLTSETPYFSEIKIDIDFGNDCVNKELLPVNLDTEYE
jgi:hypothetical protein